MIVILGAGIAGISAGYHLRLNNRKCKVFEKNASWGGLCDNFTIKTGFRFDYFVHFSFTKDDYVKKLFSESCSSIAHKPESYNYYREKWLRHPIQNNLALLSTEEKIEVIEGFVKRLVITNPKNYQEWILAQFGEAFAEKFFFPYTRKYWRTDPFELTIDWLGGRFSLPSLQNILRGAFEEQKTNFYYAQEMCYPEKGGYKSFLAKMAESTDIYLKREAVQIDLKNKKVAFSDGSIEYYEHLVSSIPLPELVKIIKDCPIDILQAACRLRATSGQLVSIGFNRPDIPKHLWSYIYDETIFPARVYSPSLKSPDNVPEGKSSLQFEVYSLSTDLPLRGRDELLSHVIDKGQEMKLFTYGDVEICDCREVKYANVIFDGNRKDAVSYIHSFLKDHGVIPIGRFGEWDYLWSDQSLLSGKKISDVL